MNCLSGNGPMKTGIRAIKTLNTEQDLTLLDYEYVKETQFKSDCV